MAVAEHIGPWALLRDGATCRVERGRRGPGADDARLDTGGTQGSGRIGQTADLILGGGGTSIRAVVALATVCEHTDDIETEVGRRGRDGSGVARRDSRPAAAAIDLHEHGDPPAVVAERIGDSVRPDDRIDPDA